MRTSGEEGEKRETEKWNVKNKRFSSFFGFYFRRLTRSVAAVHSLSQFNFSLFIFRLCGFFLLSSVLYIFANKTSSTVCVGINTRHCVYSSCRDRRASSRDSKSTESISLSCMRWKFECQRFSQKSMWCIFCARSTQCSARHFYGNWVCICIRSILEMTWQNIVRTNLLCFIRWCVRMNIFHAGILSTCSRKHIIMNDATSTQLVCTFIYSLCSTKAITSVSVVLLSCRGNHILKISKWQTKIAWKIFSIIIAERKNQTNGEHDVECRALCNFVQSSLMSFIKWVKESLIAHTLLAAVMAVAWEMKVGKTHWLRSKFYDDERQMKKKRILKINCKCHW